LTGNSIPDATRFLGTINAQPLTFKTTNATRMTITSAGKVGIGTASPSAKLTVTTGPGIAILGLHAPTTGTEPGVQGQSASSAGTGVYGLASASSGTTFGVYGNSRSSNGFGVYGVCNGTTGTGVHGLGSGDASTGVSGISVGAHGTGVYGESESPVGYGIYGLASASSGKTFGVYGKSVSPGGYLGAGVYGVSTGGDGTGVIGEANTGEAYGVWGKTSASEGVGVYGLASALSGTTYGVYGDSRSPDGSGVYGVCNTIGGRGVYGISAGTLSIGLYGVSTGSGGRGVIGRAANSSGDGVRGETTGNAGSGVVGVATATSGASIGVFGACGSPDGHAGLFNGNVSIIGNLNKSAGSFKIDHPLDPENKYLYHSFVESPDMMNVYNGNVTLEANGEATVELPAWFEALNKDFRYQLTAIGAPGPNLYIAAKIKENRFSIAGGTPGMEVSWQVSGIRQDAYAQAHRIVVEQEKAEKERGKYLHPTEHGQPEERGIDYEQRRAALATLKIPADPEALAKPVAPPIP
jgi:hypothetical protein